MNKPAPKEPSMDEILSSIRQIIADDDSGGAPRRPAMQAAPPPMQAAPVAPLDDSEPESEDIPDLSDILEEIEEIEPLALSPEQIIGDEGETEETGSDEAEALSFDSILADTAAQTSEPAEPQDAAFNPADDEVDRDTEAFVADFDSEPEPQPQVASAAPQAKQAKPSPTPSPMPDPTLSSDMAEQLLEPATNAAVRSTFARLNNIGLGDHGLTIEAMIRDMLRPMLKEWLDENLPSVVERLVEKEIARVSRGE